MQNTYKGLTARKIAAAMVPDAVQPAIYWITIRGVEYRVTAHRDTVEMASGSMGSSLVLEAADGPRIVLRWDGSPQTVESMTIAAA